MLAADDSVVARALIEQGLDAVGLPFIMTKSGKQAWDQLHSIAQQAEAEGKTIYEKVALVLTDLEMPEMDGFTLTRSIKKSARFNNLPVVIHSSLSATTSEEHVSNAEADAYVAKFSSEKLASAIRAVVKTLLTSSSGSPPCGEPIQRGWPRNEMGAPRWRGRRFWVWWFRGR